MFMALCTVAIAQRQPETFAKPVTDGMLAARRHLGKSVMRYLISSLATSRRRSIFRFQAAIGVLQRLQPEKSKPFRVLPNAFLPDRLAFRLPNKNQRKTKKPPIRGSFVYRLPQSLTHTSTSAQYRQNAYPRKRTFPRAVSA